MLQNKSHLVFVAYSLTFYIFSASQCTIGEHTCTVTRANKQHRSKVNENVCTVPQKPIPILILLFAFAVSNCLKLYMYSRISGHKGIPQRPSSLKFLPAK